MTKLIKTFTNEDLDNASKTVGEDRAYGEEERLIRDCFRKYPLNTSREIVAMKIGLIDITNSTNISRYKSKISVAALVDVLLNIKDLDERLKNGDLSLVNEIASTTKNVYEKNLFSFATKYCCYHNIFVYGGDAFSIYDTVLHKHLPNYISGVTKSFIERCRTNCDYESYMNVINQILELNNITTAHPRRKLDNFIWYYNRKS